MTFDVHDLDRLLLVGSGVLLLCILAVRLSVRAGMPSLVVYLGIGLALGESGLGIEFEAAEVALALGYAALVLILAEGGLTTPWQEIRPVLRIGVSLATVGVAVSVLVVALFAHLVLGFDWQLAVLLGAVLSPTDAAAVFSVLRRVPVPRRVTGALEAESGFNDAPTIVLVTLVSAGGHGVAGFAADFVYQLAVGVVAGIAIGWLGAWVLRRSALPASGLYPLAILSLCALAYAASATVHASGFAAVYVAALVLGNAELPHRAATRSFAEGLAWLAQIGLFVMLGLLASPGRIDLETLGLAVLVGVVLALAARPLSVLASSVAQPLPPREGLFLAWAGLRGAVPIVFTTIPLAAGVPGAQRLFDIVFVLVVLDTLVTATTLPWAARVLRVVRRSEPRDVEVEAAPLERIAADLLQVTISPASRLHGVEVAELRLPPGASVSLVVRDGQSIVPDGRTVLRHGDDLLVVTARAVREETAQRLRAVSLGGRLAQWLGTRPPT